MIRVKTSSDRRAKIQNGFWGWKFLILMGIMIGTFFIKSGAFDFVWMIFGLIGGVAVSIKGNFFRRKSFCFVLVHFDTIISFD